MKKLYPLLLAFVGFGLNAQVANHMVEDCNNNQNSIYQVLSTGTPLIVASKGFDCSICVSRAPGWGNWASNNPQVAVWGAMTNTYNSNIPPCSQLATWVSNHGWSDIYSFIDSSKHFFEFGTPRYIVYDPSDSTIAYEGGNQSTARSTALGLVSNNISLKENALESLYFYYQDGNLNFENVPEGNTALELYNLAGKKERSLNLGDGRKSFMMSGLPSGIYLMRLQNSSAVISRKIVLP
ncbi:MAG: T9SS type A sorting domain-containing protein [Croceimicrobium sp.]